MTGRAFDTLLIANRGEIACRVIDTARSLGLRTVAVYSEADAGARHVSLADVAVPIGPAAAADSYLRGERIIEAALAMGAGAIHPGYGFLSENPDFVAAVEAAGLVFVGPSADAIRAMGLKDAAKARMEAAGVPVVPGYHGSDQSDARLTAEAERIGYPVLIKAVAGGGGKGMRAVEGAADFAEALVSARAEARNAFGNADVLIEKLIQTPRHIEVQIFGDGTRAVHLFERDCSLQRRHQKVVEEAPAPGMTDEMRAAMGAAAVRAAEAVGYRGAGTVEFIVDASEGLRPDGFWFMEMNTRLQVEHPVTEEITGVDLVAWQIEVASGAGLPMSQDQLSIDGHAIEVRLYAEDPDNGFLPATGTLEHLALPPGVRVDTGVRQGDAITPHYDPMIAKITVHGSDRSHALHKMDRALAGTRIAGTTTNLGFLRRLIALPDFRSGAVETGLIGRTIGTLTAKRSPSPEALALAAVAALDPDWTDATGFTLWSPLRHLVTLGDETLSVAFESGGAEVAVGDCRISVVRRGESWWIDGRKTDAVTVRTAQGVSVLWDTDLYFALPDPLARSRESTGAGAIEAPMPGQITEVRVAPGADVVEGQRLVTLEAMKMEHVLRAPRAGTVAEVRVNVGDQVEAGTMILSLAIEEGAE